VIFVKKVFSLLFVLFSTILLFAQVSLAQTETRTTRLNFEDELIQGDVSSPDLLFILKSKNANYGRLLKLRDHFLPELNETKYDILRGTK
jgi:hypothetical protein